MKIKRINTRYYEKCKNCNWENKTFYYLDSWKDENCLCANCFVEELFNSKEYQIIHNKKEVRK